MENASPTQPEAGNAVRYARRKAKKTPTLRDGDAPLNETSHSVAQRVPYLHGQEMAVTHPSSNGNQAVGRRAAEEDRMRTPPTLSPQRLATPSC
ncbi:hypothetical protein MTO96_021663 [Rhipicephalus appendiculatus]